jgi:hypothetical protein
MITVRDLAEKLIAYCSTAPGNGYTEVMIAFDGDIAFPFLCGNDNQAMEASGSIEKFLVLMPDLKSGKKLKLKGMI